MQLIKVRVRQQASNEDTWTGYAQDVSIHDDLHVSRIVIDSSGAVAICTREKPSVVFLPGHKLDVIPARV